MFYETEHSSTAADLVTAPVRIDFQYPLHLHKGFECIVVTEGMMRIRVGKESYEVEAGQAVFIFPDQVHGLETIGHSKHFLTIFAPEYVKAFLPFCLDHVPESNLFVPSAGLAEQLMSLCKEDSILHIKGVLYTLVDEFDRTARDRSRFLEKEALLQKVFDFVSRNYAGECTLKSLSEGLSYHYAYLSRYFTDRTGLTFSEYVNSYRVGESCYRLTNSTDSITRVALECGFESIRSFHRNFKEQTGQTPGEYRAAYLEKMEKAAGTE